MSQTWLKQTAEPLFPKVLWNRPVSKHTSGKLLIVGGHASQFKLTQSTYQAALAAGIGTVKVALPDKIRKLTGSLPDLEFLPSTPSGSFARASLDELLAFAKEVDGVLIVGELSHNTETIGLLEELLRESPAPVMISEEVIKSLIHVPLVLEKASVMLATPQVFSDLAHTFNIPIYVKVPNLMKEVSLLEALAEKIKPGLVCYGEQIVVRSEGQTSVTGVKKLDLSTLYALCAAFWIQQPNKFEALTTAAYLSQNPES